MDADEFRKRGHELVDWIATYRETLEALPVMSRVKPGEIRARFSKEPPARGGSVPITELLDREVVPGITHWSHPGFFAYFPSNTTYASILGDLAAAGLGAQGMSWQTSPAATEIEEVVMDWLRQIVGLSTAWTGVIQDTASTATLGALICAREKGGSIVYASQQAHSSIDKGARLAGLTLRSIAVDEHFAMRPDALAAAIAEDVDAGHTPCAIVATSGTTNTTAFDPIAAIATIAEHHGIWFHVDAAMAGTAMALPECRHLWAGIERADSLVFNPHKWMGAGFDLSASYVRDPQHLIRVMGTNPTYLRTAQDAQVSNFRDWHIQLGRRFRALKLWFYLLDAGVEGLQARLRRDLENAQWFAAQVRASADWEVIAPVPLQTVCIRHRRGEDLAIARAINARGHAYLTTSVANGAPIIRVSIGAERTERRHVASLWDELVTTSRTSEA